MLKGLASGGDSFVRASAELIRFPMKSATPERKIEQRCCKGSRRCKCDFTFVKFFCETSANRTPPPLLPFWGFWITHTHTHPVGFLLTSDQLVAKTATDTTHNKHMGRTSVPSAGLEPAISAIKWPQTCALDCTAIGIGAKSYRFWQNISGVK